MSIMGGSGGRLTIGTVSADVREWTATVHVDPFACVSPEGAVVETVPPLPPLATPEDDRVTLVATPVVTEADALAMGFIRDVQRAGFSADQSAIDEARQLAWWRHNRLRVNGFLYRWQGALVAYGALIQRDDGTWVSSCAVLPAFTGRSFGKRLLSHLINSVDHEVYARALLSNPAAVALHNPQEWEQTGVDDICVYFRTRPKVKLEVSLSPGDYGITQPDPEPPCGWWMASVEQG